SIIDVGIAAVAAVALVLALRGPIGQAVDTDGGPAAVRARWSIFQQSLYIQFRLLLVRGGESGSPPVCRVDLLIRRLGVLLNRLDHADCRTGPLRRTGIIRSASGGLGLTAGQQEQAARQRKEIRFFHQTSSSQS